MDALQILGQRIQELRKEKKKTQKEMGEFLEMTSRNYQRIEYGEIDLQATVICTLADYFGVSADYLLGRSDERT